MNAALARRMVCLAFLSVLLVVSGHTHHAQVPEPAPMVLRLGLAALPRTLDPHKAGDTLSFGQASLAYESPLEYDPFSPGTLRPCLLTSLPEVSPDGLTWTLKLRDDLLFHDSDVFFDGKGRKAIARDLAWSLKRLAALPDSEGFWVIEGKVAGLDVFAQKGWAMMADEGEEEWFQFLDSPVAGITVVNATTLRITLVEPSADFIYFLASTYAAMMAPEAAKKGKPDTRPVGTGPFVFNQTQAAGLVWRRNPGYRKLILSGVPESSPLKPFEGKRLPLADELRYQVYETDGESQHAFLSGQIHMDGLGGVIDRERWAAGASDAELLPEDYAKAGARLVRSLEPTIGYMSFNFNDPVLGTKAGATGLALRQALALCMDRAATGRRTLSSWNNALTTPGMTGHFDDMKLASQSYDPVKGRELLQKAGFEVASVEGKWVTRGKDGKQVTVSVSFRRKDDVAKEDAQVYAKCFQEVGILLDPKFMLFSQFLQQQIEGKGQIYDCGWVFDYPHAINLMSLLYGPNKSSGVNTANFSDESFDKAYRAMSSGNASVTEMRGAMAAMYKAIDANVPWIVLGWRTLFRVEAKDLATPSWDPYRTCSAKFYALRK